MTGSKQKLLICSGCSKEYSSQAWFAKHVCNSSKGTTKMSKLKKTLAQKNSWLPVFEFSDDLFFLNSSNSALTSNTALNNHDNHHLKIFEKFCFNKADELKILHININGIRSKIKSIHEVLDDNVFDIICINESKLDNSIPDSLLTHVRYTLHRRDRNFSGGEGFGRNGGGLLIFIRKNYIHSVEVCNNFEAMHLAITHKQFKAHILVCYKSPSINDSDYLEFLNSKVSDLNPNDPLFIIGDLNMDLNSVNGKQLQEFMNDLSLSNLVKEPTRVQSRLIRKESSSGFRESSTLIDVILHNNMLISNTLVTGCPDSDHKFVAISIQIAKPVSTPTYYWSRNLSEQNLLILSNKLSALNYSSLDKLNSCNDKWLFLKNIITSELDKVSPLKKKIMKQENKFPWFDLELSKAKSSRDNLYAKFSTTRLDDDWNLYAEARNHFQGLTRSKMISYFEFKSPKDFKNSKKFWKLYKNTIKIRSDKSGSDGPTQIMNDSNAVSDPAEIAELFNKFFTSINSVSLSSNNESVQFIEKHFNNLKKEKIFDTKLDGFSFSRVSEVEVKIIFEKLSSSSAPGVSGIHPKILKLIPDILIPIYTNLFNYCIVTNTIPDEWKSAVVTPLFKNKGSKTEMKNYRAISVLSPISKVFERLLSNQITRYFESNNLFYSGQHGFRRHHSCETALHELISDLNSSKDKKLISLLFFIDFRQAFDCVDSSLLLSKLFHYGFDTSSLILIANYFTNRNQVTKIGNVSSDNSEILNGVPQGSILGPLFFLIFINDLPLYLKELSCKIFADDTTLYHDSEELDKLINEFTTKVKPLFAWCASNRIDINWSKSYCMFSTNRRIKLPTTIVLSANNIQVVDTFKLLGVTLDNKLNFRSHCAQVCRTINSKLFTIKNIFYLCTSVKVQFFKTFIMPYFDYCSSLYIYFNKESLKLLVNKFYFCIYKLFGSNFSDFSSLGEINIFLEKKFNLSSFQTRVYSRFALFTFKAIHLDRFPARIKEIANNNFITNSLINIAPPDDIRTLRNNKDVCTTVINTNLTYDFFSNSLIDTIGPSNFISSFSSFKKFIKLNVNSLIENSKFCKFNIAHKHFNWTKI